MDYFFIFMAFPADKNILEIRNPGIKCSGRHRSRRWHKKSDKQERSLKKWYKKKRIFSQKSVTFANRINKGQVYEQEECNKGQG